MIPRTLFYVAIALLILTSCQNATSNGGGNQNNSVTYSMEFDLGSVHHSLAAGPTGPSQGVTYDGLPFVTYTTSGTKTYYMATKSTFSASTLASSEYIQFYFPSNNPTGTIVADNGAAGNFDYSPDGTNKYFAEPAHSMTVTITRNDTIGGLIQGTFTGSLSDQQASPTIIQITNGTFTIKHYPNSN